MTWKMKADRPTLVVGCSLGLLLLLVLYWVLHFWFVRQEFAAEIDSIMPRTARILGIMESAEQLREASSAAGEMLGEAAYSSDRDSAATAAAMQQDIRELMMGAGLSISGTQILPLRRDEGFDQLSLDITVEGNVDSMAEAFVSLEERRPLVVIKSVKLKPSRSRGSRRKRSDDVQVMGAGDPRMLTAQFQLISLRLQD